YKAERLTVIAPQHVVDESLAVSIGHAADFELAITGLVQGPASLLEEEIDEVVASCGFRVVVCVQLVRRSPLRFSNLGAQTRQLLVERRLIGEQGRELLIPLAQDDLELLQLLSGLSRRRTGLG